MTDRAFSFNAVALGEAREGVAEPSDYRIVLRCGGITAESGSFGVARVPHCDLVISDPYLEMRNGSQGFRAKATDLGGDFNGWVVISYWCGKMGLGNAIQERRRLELRRGVPSTVRFSNLRSSYFENECDVNFVFKINPDRAVTESNYENNGTQKKFCWQSGHDGRFFSLRMGRNFATACEACSVVIRPEDVDSVDGSRVRIRLEITLQNCGREAVRGGEVLINESWNAGRSARSVRLIRGIDIESGNYKILFETVTLERHADNGLHIVFNCDESGALAENNKFHCHPNFVGF